MVLVIKRSPTRYQREVYTQPAGSGTGTETTQSNIIGEKMATIKSRW